jgi:hypothetical protein
VSINCATSNVLFPTLSAKNFILPVFSLGWRCPRATASERNKMTCQVARQKLNVSQTPSMNVKFLMGLNSTMIRETANPKTYCHEFIRAVAINAYLFRSFAVLSYRLIHCLLSALNAAPR